MKGSVAMAKVLYTANAHVTGGRSGHGRTADGQLDVDLRLPTEMGGEGGGTNPEELFAVGWAACFESALAGVARRRHLDVGEVAIESAISLLPTGDGGFKLAATLNVSIPAVAERDVAVELIRGAHEVCPYSNATRGNVDVELLLDGQAL
jgi:osmotically inducible protein OsmC